MRIAFLIGRDAPSTRLSIEAVCSVSGVVPAAILIDVYQPPLSRRVRNMWRNIRREGIVYLPHRAVLGLHALLERLARRVVDREAVDELLRAAFPDRSQNLTELAGRYGIPVVSVNNLNSPAASAALKDLNVDLGIVLGTRILKRSTFAVPRLGSINLHKGSVPHYRGMPPGFWELYDGVKTAGITVHFVDDGLDTGDVVGTREVEITDADTENTLRIKLDREGAHLLASCVGGLRDGTLARTPQPPSTGKARTIPTRRQREELRRRAPSRFVPPASSNGLRRP